MSLDFESWYFGAFQLVEFLFSEKTDSHIFPKMFFLQRDNIFLNFSDSLKSPGSLEHANFQSCLDTFDSLLSSLLWISRLFGRAIMDAKYRRQVLKGCCCNVGRAGESWSSKIGVRHFTNFGNYEI